MCQVLFRPSLFLRVHIFLKTFCVAPVLWWMRLIEGNEFISVTHSSLWAARWLRCGPRAGSGAVRRDLGLPHAHAQPAVPAEREVRPPDGGSVVPRRGPGRRSFAVFSLPVGLRKDSVSQPAMPSYRSKDNGGCHAVDIYQIPSGKMCQRCAMYLLLLFTLPREITESICG